MIRPRAPRARGLRAVLLSALLASACSNLPVVELPATPADFALRLTDARGPLTQAQTRQVLQRLEGGGKAADLLQRHVAIEQELAGTPLLAGNEVRLLLDGPATYRAMLAAIEAARSSINMETYILDDDEVGRRFAQALIDRQRQGVQVHLIYDAIGTLSTPAPFFRRLADNGVQVLQFNPVNPLLARAGWRLNNRDHRKLLIVDGNTAFLGGINISRVYSGSSLSRSTGNADESLAWRDTDLRVQGPVVAEFQKLFIDTWRAQNGPPLDTDDWFPPMRNAGGEVMRAIGSSPQQPLSPIYASLLSAIRSAEQSVYLTNAYFVPDPQLIEALGAAARRGVDVRLVLPGRTDSWLTLYAGRRYYSRLLRDGVRIYERRGVILHSKTALIDGVWSTVGSTNLDWRSFLHNQEVNAVVLGAGFGAQLKRVFDRDLATSDPIELSSWNERQFGSRLKEWFAGVFEYWL